MKILFSLILFTAPIYAQDNLVFENISLLYVAPSTIASFFGQPSMESETSTPTNIQNLSIFPLPEGIESIFGHDPARRLIVKGTKEGIADLKESLKLLDVAPEQTEVKVQFFSSNLAKQIKNRVAWGYRVGNLSVNVLGEEQNPSMLFQVGPIKADFFVASSKHYSEQSIIGITGESSTISSGLFIPYIEGGPIFLTRDGIFVGSLSLEYQSVITSLSAIARIVGPKPRQGIFVSLIARVQEVIGWAGNSAYGKLPIVSSFTVSTTVYVRNGESLAIAGLKKNRDSVNCIPFCNSKLDQHEESVIILTSKVLE